jgi:hypothetical protein
MTCGRLARRFEAPDEEQQWYGGERQPSDDAEAIHESEEAYLMLQLLVQVSMRSAGGIGTGEFTMNKIMVSC